jgi:hypothetical protein
LANSIGFVDASSRLLRSKLFLLHSDSFCWFIRRSERLSETWRSFPFLKTAANFKGLSAMALQAKGAHIRKAAFPATFYNRDDMIGIPQAFSAAQVPLGGSTEASGSA